LSSVIRPCSLRSERATIGGMSDGREHEGVAVPILWVGAEDVPVIAANHFLLQVHEGEIFLSAGTLTPPVVLGNDPEDLRRQIDAVSFVPVKTVARFSLNRRRLGELITLLDDGAKKYDDEDGEQ
jgi:hypothetical protein